MQEMQADTTDNQHGEIEEDDDDDFKDCEASIADL